MAKYDQGGDCSCGLYSECCCKDAERVGFNGGGGMLAFAWFVFDKRYDGKPRLEWI